MEASSSKREATTANSCRLFQLPYPIILDILSRVPIDDLFPCRCVCKRFLCFISDPEFVRLHLSRSPFCMLLPIAGNSLPYSQTERLYLTHLDADGANFQVSKLNFTPTNNLPCYGGMSACNGLLLLSGPSPLGTYGPLYVCNPILGEFITIQQPYKDRDSGRLMGGLGYSAKTNQYKVLLSYKPRPLALSACPTVELYTIGTGTWRSIENVPDISRSSGFPLTAYLNGALHWSFTDSEGAYIHTFDFDVEQFGTVPPPDHPHTEPDIASTIGVLGSCLFVIYFTCSMTFDIWVMKEYGKKESWTKQFVVEYFDPVLSEVGDYHQPMFVLSNGEILILHCNTQKIFYYNQERKEFRRTDFFPTRFVPYVNAYTPSFVSLCDLAKGEKISRLQSTRVYDRICTTQEFQDYTGCGARLVNSD